MSVLKVECNCKERIPFLTEEGEIGKCGNPSHTKPHTSTLEFTTFTSVALHMTVDAVRKHF